MSPGSCVKLSRNGVPMPAAWEIFRIIKGNSVKNIIWRYKAFTTLINLEQSTLPTKPQKVNLPKGTWCIGEVSSLVRWRSINLVCFLNVCGVYAPPFLIFPPKEKNIDLLYGWAHLWYKLYDSRGFAVYLKHLVEHRKPSVASPVLLHVENHALTFLYLRSTSAEKKGQSRLEFHIILRTAFNLFMSLSSVH